jgi:hypothetical protein
MDRQAAHNRVVAGIFAVGGLVGALVTQRFEFLVAGGVLGGLFLVPDLMKGRDDGED